METVAIIVYNLEVLNTIKKTLVAEYGAEQISGNSYIFKQKEIIFTGRVSDEYNVMILVCSEYGSRDIIRFNTELKVYNISNNNIQICKIKNEGNPDKNGLINITENDISGLIHTIDY